MKNKKKALLLSALVFPGAGHFIIGKKRTAWFLIITATLALLVFSYVVMQRALIIIEQIKLGEIKVLDVQLLTQQLTHQGGIADSLPILFLLLWLFAIIDVWRTKPASEQ